MSTYSGKLLRINLSDTTSNEEEIPTQFNKKFISARGLGAKYLYDELSPNIDPLSPDNKLLLLIGVLGGTGLQGFSKWTVMSKSPLTGTIFRSVTGGNFGVWMKHAGYDLIIIEGQAAKPSYVHIDEQGVHFLGAKNLLGLDYRRLQQRLKETHGIDQCADSKAGPLRPCNLQGADQNPGKHLEGAPPQTNHEHSGDTVHYENCKHDGHPAHKKLPGRKHPDHRRPIRRQVF
jgi:aldehyde:ferredoxin oxidoreductase